MTAQKTEAGVAFRGTPGPWIAWDDGRTVGIVDKDSDYPIAVAEVVDHGDMAAEGRLLADQRLTAAAPDLLKFAQMLDASLSAKYPQDLNEIPNPKGSMLLCIEPQIWTAARTAIARAVGNEGNG